MTSKKRWIFIVLDFLFVSCINHTTHKNGQMKFIWKKLLNTEIASDYCKIDSINNGYIISYSHSPAVSGGFKIIKLIKSNDSNDFLIKVLLEDSNNTLSSSKLYKNKLGCISVNFDKNTLQSNYLYSDNLGKVWDTLKSSIKNIRKFIIDGQYTIFEGYQNGVTQIFSFDSVNKNWRQINYFNKGFKDFSLLDNYNISKENDILCSGSKGYNFKSNELFIYNVKTDSILKLLDLNNDDKFLIPISKGEKMFSVINKNNIKVYLSKGNSFCLLNKFKTPTNTNDVQELYMSDSFYLITATNLNELKSKSLTWISYDKGENWMPFYQERGIKLIDNSFGIVTVIDNDNNILLSN